MVEELKRDAPWFHWVGQKFYKITMDYFNGHLCLPSFHYVVLLLLWWFCFSGQAMGQLGQLTTVSGSGTASPFANGYGTYATFFWPYGVGVNGKDEIFVADTYNHAIRRIDPQTLAVTTFAGGGGVVFADGQGAAASFYYPVDICFDVQDTMYVADQSNYRVRKINPVAYVTTLAGSGTGLRADGTGTAASFVLPVGVAADKSLNVYVADSYGFRIRKISPAGVVSTLAGSGVAPLMELVLPLH